MSRCVIVLAVLLALPVSARGQDLSDFAGEWKNPKATLAIVGARIYPQGKQWMVQLLGACHPTPCIWDPVPLSIKPAGPLDPRSPATAPGIPNNLFHQITLWLGEDSLTVRTVTPRPGPHGQPPDDVLIRVKATTEPLPPMRRSPRPPAPKR